jgi:Zn-dependent protease with chaperone function
MGTALAPSGRAFPHFMFGTFSGACVVLLLALLPGTASWWFGRRLSSRIDDPTLPELLAAHRRRNGAMFGAVVAAAGWVAVWSEARVGVLVAVSALVAYAGLVAAAYPLRRSLYQETWTFRAYCSFYPRLVLGLFGFWLTLAALPAVASLAGRRDWVVAAALGVLLLLWNNRYAGVVRACLRTRLLPEGELLTGCRELARRSGATPTRFEYVDLGGGVFPNAMALPSLRGSSVVFTSTLLERFDHREMLAICAHELAHFEHYNPHFLQRVNNGNQLLIVLGAATEPVSRLAGLGWGTLVSGFWLAAVVVSLAIRARGKQRQETACDLRAVDLTQDGEATIRALTKLYTIARLPRRLDQQAELSATHPSLARRIRDIRRAAGLLPVAVAEPVRVSSTDGGTSVTFNDTNLHWIERNGSAHSRSYAELTELRLDARPQRRPRLVVTEVGGRRWEMPLRGADISSIQAVLDLVDGRLADPVRPPLLTPRIPRMVLLASGMLALLFSQSATVFVALLAWFKPTAALVAGTGLALLTAAALLLRDHSSTPYLPGVVLLAVAGLALVRLAQKEREENQSRVRPFIAVLGLAAACALGAVTTYGINVVSLHRGARALPSATVLVMALVGALACSPGRRRALSTGAACSLAIALTLVGSDAVMDRLARDSFVVDAPALRWRVLDAKPVQTFDVPAETSRIDLSPSGQSIAVYREDYDDDEHASSVQVGRIGGELTSISVDQVAFVTDDEILTLRSDSHAATLRVERLRGSRDVLWQHVVDGLSAPALALDHATGHFDVVGWHGATSLVRVDGDLRSAGARETRWPVARNGDGYVAAVSLAGPDALIVEMQYERNILARALPWRWTWAHLLLPVRTVTRYATMTGDARKPLGESKLDVSCLANAFPASGLTCTAFDGSRTRIVAIDAGTGAVKGIGVIDGRFFTDHVAVAGWLTGWAAGTPVAIHVTSGEAFRMAAPAVTLRLVAASGDRLAALMMADDGLTVRVYAPLSAADDGPESDGPDTVWSSFAPDCAPHSARSAMIGSIRIACNAGGRTAQAAAMMTRVAAAPIPHMSR